jgi:hypothetical protein
MELEKPSLPRCLIFSLLLSMFVECGEVYGSFKDERSWEVKEIQQNFIGSFQEMINIPSKLNFPPMIHLDFIGIGAKATRSVSVCG